MIDRIKNTDAYKNQASNVKQILVLKSKSVNEIKQGVAMHYKIGEELFLQRTNLNAFQQKIVLELCK